MPAAIRQSARSRRVKHREGLNAAQVIADAMPCDERNRRSALKNRTYGDGVSPEAVTIAAWITIRRSGRAIRRS